MTNTSTGPLNTFVQHLIDKHRQYLPAMVDYYTCGECNKHLPGGEVQAWPCPVIRELVDAGLYPKLLARPDPKYLEEKYGFTRTS